MKKLTKSECISRLSTLCVGCSVWVGPSSKLWVSSVKYRNSRYHDVQMVLLNNVKLSDLSYHQLLDIVRKVGTSRPMEYCLIIRRGENGRPRLDWSNPVDIAAFSRSLGCIENWCPSFLNELL